MRSQKLTALVPCRAGSKRVPAKNTRAFTAQSQSLLEVKLLQLAKLAFVDEIVVSTDDPACVAIAKATLGPHVRIDQRPHRLAQDNARLSDLIEHFGQIVSGADFLWTHVTSPFFSVNHYREAYEDYDSQDFVTRRSLMAVERVQDFLWFGNRPLNFGSGDIFWPRSQDLVPALRVTSGLFLGRTTLLREARNRICTDPKFFEVSGPSAIDIDWASDFNEASELVRRHPSLVE